jgi:hypothetical protein
MGALETNTTLIYGIHIRESANDGSDFTNAAADYRVLFLGEDGVWHAKDSAGTVTEPFTGGSSSVATDTIWDAAGDLVQGTGADTAAKLSAGTAGQVLTSAGAAAANAWGPGPAIVQVKTANSASRDATTAVTMQDSSLSLAFTPLFSDSILHVSVDGECSGSRVAGTIQERHIWIGILNSTNSVELVRQVRGLLLIGTSGVAATIYEPIALKGLYTVNSTAARTFKLQYMSTTVTNVEAAIEGTRTGGVTMTIMEVRP